MHVDPDVVAAVPIQTERVPLPADNAGPTPVVDYDELVQRLDGSMWGPIEVVDETGSTNADLLAQARAGASTGTVLIAGRQTLGRGRFQRVWESPAGASVSVSMIVRPSQPMTQWPWLSAAAGMAVRQGIMAATGCDPRRLVLKWPNDVLLDGKKVCGILAEQTFQDGQAAVVIGIGINTFMDQDQLPIVNATSLQLAQLKCNPTSVVAEVLTSFAHYWDVWEATGTLRNDYRQQLGTLGREVNVVITADQIETGLAVDVDEYGQLVVKVDGQRRAYSAGDVTHLR